MKQAADEAAEQLRETLVELWPAFSFSQIAEILNLRGERTWRGKKWSDVAFLRACRRLGLA